MNHNRPSHFSDRIDRHEDARYVEGHAAASKPSDSAGLDELRRDVARRKLRLAAEARGETNSDRTAHEGVLGSIASEIGVKPMVIPAVAVGVAAFAILGPKRSWKLAKAAMRARAVATIGSAAVKRMT